MRRISLYTSPAHTPNEVYHFPLSDWSRQNQNITLIGSNMTALRVSASGGGFDQGARKNGRRNALIGSCATCDAKGTGARALDLKMEDQTDFSTSIENCSCYE